MPQRIGVLPSIRYAMPKWKLMAQAVSNSATSTYWPSPVRLRWKRAARVAWAAPRPVVTSIIGMPVRVGSPSGRPVIDMKPLSAWATGS